MRINNNISALNAWRGLTNTDNALSKSLEKLSSGLRINRAGDDAAGLAISEKMRGQIRGLNQASRNAQDGISLIQTAEGALNETHSILQRMRELAVQASNATNTDEDRAEIQKEMNQLTSEITRIGDDTRFNAMSLINGDMTGAGSDAKQETLTVDLSELTGAVEKTGTVKLSIGGDTYTISLDKTAAASTDTYVSATKTIKIGTLTDRATDIAGAIEKQLKAMRGDDPTLSMVNFDIVGSGTGLTIKATAGGLFDGAAGNGSLKQISGLTAEENLAAGANGTGGEAKLQIGANKGQLFTVDIADMRAKALNISGDDGSVTGYAEAVFKNGALDISDSDKATAAIEVIDKAIESVSSERSKLGAYQNRLEHTIRNLGVAAENLSAAESRIRDVDMAAEMMNFTKQNILIQAGTAMMAQANARPQSVLQLLG